MINILAITQETGPDYLSDLILESLANNNKVNLYVNYLPPYLINTYSNFKGIYGRGFTAFGNINKERASKITTLTRDSIKTLADSKKFDFIIYTSIQRNSLIANELLDSGGTTPIIFLDGEDNTDILDNFASKSFYFKREIDEAIKIDKYKYLRSISFRVNKKKIFNKDESKTRLIAPCDPRDRRTYIYNDENSYYNQYKTAYFGITMKKGGWDCMRHYEIIMNRCLPLFIGIEDMPKYTMREYPRQLQMKCNSLYDKMRKNGVNDYVEVYNSYVDQFHSWLCKDMTTSAYLKFLIRNSLCEG